MTIRVTDLYWLAGYLEGGGCFHFTGHSPTVIVTSTDKDPIDRCFGLLKFGHIYQKNRKTKTGKTVYSYSAHGMRAVQVMMTIFILMSQRRQGKIKEVLRLWLQTNRVCYRGHELSGDNLKISPSGRHRCLKCASINGHLSAGKPRQKKLIK